MQHLTVIMTDRTALQTIVIDPQKAEIYQEDYQVNWSAAFWYRREDDGTRCLACLKSNRTEGKTEKYGKELEQKTDIAQ